MKLEDLKVGNIVVFRNNKVYLYIGEAFVNSNGYIKSTNISKEMCCSYNSDYDVIKVYKIKDGWGCGLDKILNIGWLEDYAVILWERTFNIDWDKVPEGTPLICWDEHYGDYVYRYFVKYSSKSANYPICVSSNRCIDEMTGYDYRDYSECWMHAKIHPSVKIDPEWLKEE